MSEPVAGLRSVLRQAKAAARRRLLLRALIDVALGGVVLTALAALCAGLTLRGDLAALGWAGAIGVVAAPAAAVGEVGGEDFGLSSSECGTRRGGSITAPSAFSPLAA